MLRFFPDPSKPRSFIQPNGREQKRRRTQKDSAAPLLRRPLLDLGEQASTNSHSPRSRQNRHPPHVEGIPLHDGGHGAQHDRSAECNPDRTFPHARVTCSEFGVVAAKPCGV